MSFPVEMQADALLRTLLAQNGGDLRAALTLLCARIAVEDLTGETFDQALGRAVRDLFGRLGVIEAISADPPAALLDHPAP